MSRWKNAGRDKRAALSPPRAAAEHFGGFSSCPNSLPRLLRRGDAAARRPLPVNYSR